MWRLVLFAVIAVTTTALQVADLPDPMEERMQFIGSRAVSALDPELTNTAGEVFHVTVAGEWQLIGMPKATGADLTVNATLENATGAGVCDDLLIRKVEVTGTKLGTNITGLEFTVASDAFNDTAVLGLTITTPDGATNTYDPSTFLQKVPQCTITRPRGSIALPTKNSYRKRTRLFTAVCILDGGANVITMHWSTVWRGFDKTVQPMTGYYLNDMDVFASGVGDDPAGLLGPDDHSDATRLVSNCPKKQPINGPYQTRMKQ